jgi:hypothetical protein
MPAVGRRLLASVALLAALAAVYSTRTADADLWGHLRYGRLMVEEGLPTADPFAWTSAGRPWFTHEYLSQMLLWLAYAAGDSLGLIILKCLLGGAAVGLVYSAVRLATAEPRVWVPVLLLSIHVLCRWFLFRPQLFTFVLFAFFVRILLAHLLGRPARLWLLPLAIVLWVNLHGGFLAGLGAVGLALLLRAAARPRASLRPLLLTLLGCAAASLLNPHGWRLIPYLATELTCDVNRRFIAEWQPLNFSDDGWTAWTFAGLLAALAGACLAAGPRRRRAGLAHWQWLTSCVPLAVLACRSVRHIPLCALWTAPVLALLAQAAWEIRMPAWRRLWAAVAGLAVAPAVLTMVFVLAKPAPSVSATGAVLGKHPPFGAVAFLREQGLAGRVWNPLWWGSYLTWELYPAVLVSMDGRNVTLFSREAVAENLTFYLAEEADSIAPLRQAADLVLVPADAPVLAQLREDDHWTVLYDDGDAVVFARVGTAAAALDHKADP